MRCFDTEVALLHPRALVPSLVLALILLLPAAAPAAPPVASIVGPPAAMTSQPLGFDGEGSRDPAGRPLVFSWSIDGTRVGFDHSWLSVAFSKPGRHVIELVVTTPDGESASARHVIEVAGQEVAAINPLLPVAEPADAGPRLVLSPATLPRLRDRWLRLELRCRGAARCRGLLEADAPLGRHGRTMRLGRTRFSLRRGQVRVVKLRVPRDKHRRLLQRRSPRVVVTAYRSTTRPAGGTWSAVSYVLRRPGSARR